MKCGMPLCEGPVRWSIIHRDEPNVYAVYCDLHAGYVVGMPDILARAVGRGSPSGGSPSGGGE